MNICIYQYDTVWMDHQANLSLIEKVCGKISGKADILVLPEMFNTGYTMQPAAIPVSWQEETIASLQKIAGTYSLTITGSIPMFRDGQYFNSFVTINASGLLHMYDKIHLFTLAGEKDVYSAGTVTNSYTLDGWEIKPLVCYDLRFPYLTSEHKAPDLLMYSANWPTMRVDHWNALLKARAIENQCFVAGVNRTGQDQNGYAYPGASVIFDYNGDIMSQMDENEGYIIQHLDQTKQKKYRTKLPFDMDHLRRTI